MANKIKIKRGLFANLPTLDLAEFGFTTDTKKLYIGDGTSSIKIGGEGVLEAGDNVSSLANDANYVASGDNVSELTNDANYLATGDNVSELVNDANYLDNNSTIDGGTF